MNLVASICNDDVYCWSCGSVMQEKSSVIKWYKDYILCHNFICRGHILLTLWIGYVLNFADCFYLYIQFFLFNRPLAGVTLD